MKRFSLIELLVVVAIIGILSSILLPTLGKVRTKAKITTCLNNSKALSVGLNLYTSDNNDFFPVQDNNIGWDDQISSYLGFSWTDAEKESAFIVQANYSSIKIFHCPLDEVTRTQATAGAKSYGLNWYDDPNYPGLSGDVVAVKINEVSNSSGTILLGERWSESNIVGASRWAHSYSGLFFTHYQSGNVLGTQVTNHYGDDRANISFVDGSARQMYGTKTLLGVTINNFQNTMFDRNR